MIRSRVVAATAQLIVIAISLFGLRPNNENPVT